MLLSRKSVQVIAERHCTVAVVVRFDPCELEKTLCKIVVEMN